MQKTHSCSCNFPSWVEGLVGVWAVGETAQESGRLGWPTVSPMFGQMGESEPGRDDSYSALEVASIAVAIDRLAILHPAEYEALQARFRPRLARTMGLAAPNQETLSAGLTRLAKWVDELVEDPSKQG